MTDRPATRRTRRPRSARRVLGRLGTVLVAATLLAGCGSSGDPSGSSGPSGSAGSSGAPSSGFSGPGTQQYVAIGDSYTAAPVLTPAESGDNPCGRSQIDYPHLLVRQLTQYSLADVSCSGADSGDVLDGWTTEGTRLPPQTSLLSADTKLVTVSIGGNDQSLFSTLLGGCAQLAGTDPGGSPCRTQGQALATKALSTIRTDVDQVVAAIRRAAPNATVLVVGYPKPLPNDGTTCAQVPFATGDYAFVDQVVGQLSAALKAAAAAHGATYVDLGALSRGHDVCSADPWINGGTTDASGAIPFHPLPAEQRAVASAIAADLS